MALQVRTAGLHEAGAAWLADCSAHPDPVREAWTLKTLAPITSGTRWRVAEAPLLRSVEAVARIGGDRIGPILADIHRKVAWWLLPPDLADELDDVRRVTVRPAGWVIECPPVPHSVNGRWWIECPDGSGQLTDPAALAAALGNRLPTEASR